jgi:hypothetical protein
MFIEDDYRGVPCTLVYSKSGSPVTADNPHGVTGGRAPHHASSTGYVYARTEGGGKFDRYAHVFEMEWKPQFDPDHWIVYARQKRSKDDWTEVGQFSFENNLSQFAAIGMAHVYKRDYNVDTIIKAEKRSTDEKVLEQSA